MTTRAFVKRLQRRILFRTPLRRFIVPRFQYAFSPRQLALLNDLFCQSHDRNGISVEIGCFVGATTVFLNANYRFGLPPRRYLCVDTFSGFTAEDLDHERRTRSKDLAGIDDETLFSANSLEMFRYTMGLNGCTNVEALQLDANRMAEITHVDRIAFALIDVDLYRPTKSALTWVLDRLVPGGILVIDDCRRSQRFDGSLQALEEVASERAISFTIREEKLGIIHG